MKFLRLFSHSPQPQQARLAKQKNKAGKKNGKREKLKPDSSTREPNTPEPSRHPGQTPCVTSTTTRLDLDKMALFKSPRQKVDFKFPWPKQFGKPKPSPGFSCLLHLPCPCYQAQHGWQQLTSSCSQGCVSLHRYGPSSGEVGTQICTSFGKGRHPLLARRS